MVLSKVVLEIQELRTGRGYSHNQNEDWDMHTAPISYLRYRGEKGRLVRHTHDERQYL